MATRRTDAAGHALFEPGLARGEGGLSPALLVASDPRGDYAFLNLKAPAFDFSDRGVTGRTVPAGLDAFVYTERGVYRTGETVHVTALLRDRARRRRPRTCRSRLSIERPDGVEYRRAVVADQGIGGRNLDVAIAPTASTGTWRVHAFSDPKRPAIGETTFMVEDYVPDRMEFDLASKATAVAKGKPFEVTVDGRFLYGAPASDLDIGGNVKVQAASGRPGFAGYQFGTDDEDEDKAAVEQPLEDLPQTDAAGKAKFDVTIDKLPETTRPLEAQVTVNMAEPGGRAIERKLTLPVTPASADDRRQAAVRRRLARRKRECDLRCRGGRAGRQGAGARRPALRAAQDRKPLPVVPAGRQLELRADQADQAGRRRHRSMSRPTAGPHFGPGDLGPLPPRSVEPRRHHGRPRPSASIPASMRSRAPIRPTCWRPRSTSPNTARATP